MSGFDAKIDGGYWTYDHYLQLSGMVEPNEVIQGFCCSCFRDFDNPDDYISECTECGEKILAIFTKRRLLT